MAFVYLKQRRRQQYLILIFLLVLVITLVVVWKGFLKKEEGPVAVVVPSPLREIKINFEILENPTLINLQPFEGLPPFLLGGEDVELSPALSWESVPEAEIYLWEVIGVESGRTEETSATLSKTLEPSSTYTWRVKACKENMRECSSWGGGCRNGSELQCWRFTTVKKLSLTLVSPPPEAENLPFFPALSWESVPEAEIYLWEVIGVESGRTEETSATLSKTLEPSSTYTWRVKACKENMRECSSWTSRTFSTASLFNPPELVAPPTKEITIGHENPFLPF